MTFDEIQYRWMRTEPVEGLVFLLNDSVRVTYGPAAGKTGAVIAVLGVEPEPRYLVELSSTGGDIEVVQSRLESLPASDTMSALAELQGWYAKQCDGDWEHSHGVQVETLDNPGWHVRIDLVDTHLEHAPFEEIARLEPPREWLHCRVRDGAFEGFGGPYMLGAIIRTFLDWSGATEQGTA